MSVPSRNMLRNLTKEMIAGLPVAYGCRISDKIICRVGNNLRPDVPGELFFLLAEKTEIDKSLFLAAFPSSDLELKRFGDSVRSLLIIDTQLETEDAD